MTAFPPPEIVPAPVMLVIGDIGRWEANGRDIPSMDRCSFISFDELDAGLLRALMPSYVVSALISPGFDAIDVAVRLHELGFRGSYRTLASKLPNKAAVIREITAAAPDIDFDIVILDPPE